MTQYPMVSSGGWQCGVCGAWVPNGVNHFCPRQYFPPQYYGEPTIIQHTDADCIRRAKELMRCETCSGWERKSEVHGRCRRGSEQNTVRRPTDDCVAGWEPKP